MGRLRFAWGNPLHVLLLGLLLREALSFWTAHPYDFEVWLRNGYAVAQGLDPYARFIAPVPDVSFAYLNETMPSVGYLPLWSLLLAGLYRLYTWIPGASRFILYFLVKQPVVLSDAGLGYLLYKGIGQWGGSRESALRGLRYWMLFPYPIVISAIWGQFDAIVVDLILIALLTSQWRVRFGSLGLGIALKWFPLIFLPYYFFREKRSKKSGSFAALAIPGLLTILIFTLMGWTYVGVTAMSISVSHGGGGGMTYVNVISDPHFLEFWRGIPYVYLLFSLLWVPGCIVAGYVACKRFTDTSPQSTIQCLLLITSVFYLTRFGVYEQYMLYLLPLFLVDILLWHPERRPLFNLVWVLAFAYLLVNNDFLVRFLGPVSGSFVDIAYSADTSLVLSPLRTSAMYFLDVLITVTFVQLLLVFASARRSPRPWPYTLMVWVRDHLAANSSRLEPNP